MLSQFLQNFSHFTLPVLKICIDHYLLFVWNDTVVVTNGKKMCRYGSNQYLSISLGVYV